MLTRSNYETWFIDYSDGALTESQKAELLEFLEMNPDLKAEFELFASVQLEPEVISYPDKASLKKGDINAESFKTWLVSYFENDLSPDERKMFEEYLHNHPELEKELELIRKTRLIPDYTIIFGDKKSLKKEAKVVSFNRPLYRAISIAASVVILLVAFILLNKHSSDQKEVADHRNTVPSTEQKAESPSTSTENSNSQPDSGTSPEKKQGVPGNTQQRNLPKYKPAPSLNDKAPVYADKNHPQIQDLPKDSSVVPLPVQQEQKVITPPADQNNYAQVNKKAGEEQLAELFTADELNEMGVKQKPAVKNAPSGEAKPILEVAKESVADLSKKTDISITKEKSYFTDATTYAINLGKNFSVSHTTAR